MSRFAILFAAVALVAGQVHAGVITNELLSNGGFDSSLDNWHAFSCGGVDLPFVNFDPDTGNYLQFSNDDNGNAGSYAGIFQELGAITGGEEYTFSGFAYSSDADAAAEYRIEWYDANGDLVGGLFDTNMPIVVTPDYSLFTNTVEAPANATQLRAVIAVLPQDGLDGSFFFDDISLSTSIDMPMPNPDVVPEPTTLAIFSLIGMAGFSPRRRKHLQR